MKNYLVAIIEERIIYIDVDAEDVAEAETKIFAGEGEHIYTDSDPQGRTILAIEYAYHSQHKYLLERELALILDTRTRKVLDSFFSEEGYEDALQAILRKKSGKKTH